MPNESKSSALSDRIRQNGIPLDQKKIEWKEYKLGEIAEIVGGGTPSTSNEDYWDGDIPWLSPKDLTGYNRVYIEKGARNITKEGLRKSSSKLMPAGTVLFSSRAPIGYVAIAKNEICTNQGFKSLVCNPNKLWNVFAYYWLKANTEYLQSLGTGTTFAEISGAVMKSISISIPPLSEQKRIASILSSLDDKIDLLHRENATLEAMAETLFRHLFIENPNPDWKEGVIADVIDFNPPRKLGKGEVAPFLEMSNLSTDVYAPIAWRDRAFSSGTKFINGDTLLARITPCLENGKAAYIDFLDSTQVGWGSTEYIVMRPKRKIHPFFAYIVAKYQDFRDYAESCMSGSSGRQRVDVDNLKTYRFCIPDAIAIEQFNKNIVFLVGKMANNNNGIRCLKSLSNALLPRLMSNMSLSL